MSVEGFGLERGVVASRSGLSGETDVLGCIGCIGLGFRELGLGFRELGLRVYRV